MRIKSKILQGDWTLAVSVTCKFGNSLPPLYNLLNNFLGLAVAQ